MLHWNVRVAIPFNSTAKRRIHHRVRRESNNRKHLWSSKVAAESCPTFSVASNEFVVRWGDSESWWHKIQQTILSRLDSFLFALISAMFLAQEPQPSVSIHTSISRPNSAALRSPVELETSNLSETQRRSAFVASTLSPHSQHLLHILLLCLIADTQNTHSFFSLTTRDSLSGAASVVSMCNNHLISTPPSAI